MPHFSIESLALLPLEKRAEAIRNLAPADKKRILYLWEAWARPQQLEPAGDWRTWLILAGRGYGKTRTGAEWVRKREEHGARRIHLVGATAADVRDTMVEGESGLLNVCPPWHRPKYEPSKRRLTWPPRRSKGGSDLDGAIGICFSADEPDRLRGPQADTAWGDELAAWQYPDAWDQLQFGLRLGTNPRSVVTTTPRPTPLVRALIADPSTYTTRGSTYDNRANMADAFFERMRRKYEGTRLGRQELHAEVLDDSPGALWKRDQLDALRVKDAQVPELREIVVAVDPAVADPAKKKTDADREKLDETGIIVAGIAKSGHVYVVEDASGHYSPLEWAARVVALFDAWQANYVVPETNQGGALVEANLRTIRPSLPIQSVHASRGKLTRAEPVSSLYEQGKVHHVGAFPKLEDELCTWEPAFSAYSPDRLDALVWAVTFLAVDRGVAADHRGTTVYRLHHDDTNLYDG